MNLPKRKALESEYDGRFKLYMQNMERELDAVCLDAEVHGFDLDYSAKSLDDVEEWLMIRSVEQNGDLAIERAARYVGEVFRRHLGGHWQLCKRSPRHLYYLQAVIDGFSDRDYDISPKALVRNFLVRPAKGVLQRALAANLPFRRA